MRNEFEYVLGVRILYSATPLGVLFGPRISLEKSHNILIFNEKLVPGRGIEPPQ